MIIFNKRRTCRICILEYVENVKLKIDFGKCRIL